MTFSKAQHTADYQHKKTGDILHAYACQCGKFHIGQPPFGERREGRLQRRRQGKEES